MEEQGRTRQPRGVPAGGQFRAQRHQEADADLSETSNQPSDRSNERERRQRLAELRRQFDAAGGRGIAMAEEIDGIEAELETEARMDGGGGDGGGVRSAVGNPAYPNGRCDACGQGLDAGGSCRDFECPNGPDEPDEQTLDQMRDHAGTTVIRGIDILTGDQSLGDVREFHPDFPEEKWEAAMQNLREVRDWLHGVSEDVGDDIR